MSIWFEEELAIGHATLAAKALLLSKFDKSVRDRIAMQIRSGRGKKYPGTPTTAARKKMMKHQIVAITTGMDVPDAGAVARGTMETPHVQNADRGVLSAHPARVTAIPGKTQANQTRPLGTSDL